MITIKHRGDFKKTDNFLAKILKRDYLSILQKYGEEGVIALSKATPYDTGLTADSWYYEIEDTNKGLRLYWKNSNVNKGVNIAVILQYGHGTGTGGYVEGVDYINPALKPVFQKIADGAWNEVMGD